MPLHLSTTVLLFFLTISAVGSRGFVPNVLIAMLIMVWKGPIKPAPKVAIFLTIIVNLAHIIAFTTIAVMVSTSDSQQEMLYGDFVNSFLLRGFSIFEPTSENTGLCFRAMTPSVVILFYAIIFRKRITGGYLLVNKPGGRKGAMASFKEPAKEAKRMSSLSAGGGGKGHRHVLHKVTTMKAISKAARTTVLMALSAAITSLVAPNTVAIPFLVIFSAVLCVVAIVPWSNKARGTLLRVIAAVAAFYTPLWLLFLTLSQNALYIEYVGKLYYASSIEGIGILPIDSLPSRDIIVRRYISIFFGFCATVLASVASAQSPAAYEAYTELKMILDIEAAKEAAAHGNVLHPNAKPPKSGFIHNMLVKLGRRKPTAPNDEDDGFDDVITQQDGAFFVPPLPGAHTRSNNSGGGNQKMSVRSPTMLPYSAPTQSLGAMSTASSAAPRPIQLVRPLNKYDPPVVPIPEEAGVAVGSHHSINSHLSSTDHLDNADVDNGSVPPSVGLPSPALTPRLDKSGGASKQALLASLQKQQPLPTRVYVAVTGFIASFVDGLFHYLLFIPVLPLLAVSMSIIIFPSVTSMVMLPVIWLGLLIRTSHFHVVMPVAVVLKACVNVAQFSILNWQTSAVLDGKAAKSTSLIMLYYSDTRIYYLMELFTNVAIFALMAAVAYRQIMSVDGRTSGFGNMVKVGSRKNLTSSKVLNSVSRRSQRVASSRSSGLDDSGVGGGGDPGYTTDEDYLISFREDILSSLGRRRASNIISRMVPKKVAGYDPFINRNGGGDAAVAGSGLTLDKRDNEPLDLEATFERMLGRKAGLAEMQSLRRYFRLTQVNAFPAYEDNNSEISFMSQAQSASATRRTVQSTVGDSAMGTPHNSMSARESQREMKKEAIRASIRADNLGQALESEGGNGGVTKWGLLEFFASYSEVSTFKQMVLLVRFLVIRYSMPLALLFTFVVGSLVKVLDIFHVIQLLIFLVFICFPAIAHRYWIVVVAYTILLTSFLSVYTFLQPFLKGNDPYAVDGVIKWETIGFYPYRTIWYAVPYYLCCFLVAAELTLVRGLIGHPHDWVVAYDWRRMATKELSLKWQRRLTITVATFVFLGLAVYKSASFLVEGLLLLLLVVAICTAYGAPESVRKALWTVSVIYAMLAIVLVCAYQFEDLRGGYRWVFSFFDSCGIPYRPPSADPNSAPIENICEMELGVVAANEQILTEFLAPWFVVLVVSFIHLSASIQSSRMDEKRRLGGDSSAAIFEGDDPDGKTDQNGEALLAAEELVGQPKITNAGDDPFMGDPDDDDDPFGDQVGCTRESAQDLGRHSPKEGASKSVSTKSLRDKGDDATTKAAASGGEEEESASKKRSKAALLFGSKDQRAIYWTYLLVEKMEEISVFAHPLAQDISPYLVWGALYLATTADFNFATMVYGILLVLDMGGKFTLFYCVAHIFVLYTYNFVFFPKIPAEPDFNLASVIGVTSSRLPRLAIVEPLLVFFAVLLSEMTQMNKEDRRRVYSTMVEKTNSWVIFIRYCYFDFAGYEVVLLTLLRTFTNTSRYISGVCSVASIVILILGGRNSFLTSRMRRFGPYFLTTLCFLYTFVTLLNAQQQLWLPKAGSDLRRHGWWAYFGAYGDQGVLLGNFFTLCLLHMANQRSILSINREIRTKTEFGEGVASTLPQYLSMKGIWNLSDIPEEHFGSVIPVYPDTDYCYDLVGKLLNGVVMLSYPLAIASFAAGVSHGSLLHLLLLATGLIQLLVRNNVFWRFNIVWPRMFFAYFATLLTIPLIMPIAPIAKFIGDHPTAFNILGVAIHGQPMYFHPVFVAITFFVLVHDRVLSEFSYANVLHYLSNAEGEQQGKHVALMGTLKQLDRAEVELALSKQDELKDELRRIRVISKTIVQEQMLHGPSTLEVVSTGNVEEVIAHQHELAHPEDSKVTADNEDDDVKQPDVPATKKPKKTATVHAPHDHEDKDAAAVAYMGSSARVEAGEGDAMSDDDMYQDQEDPESFANKMKARFAAISEKLTNILGGLTIKFRHYSFEREEPEKWQDKSPVLRFLVAFMLFLERHVNDLILFAVGINFLISGSVWNAIPCAFLFIFAAPCYPFAPALIYDMVAVYVLIGMVIKNLAPILTYNTRLSQEQSQTFSTLFIQIPTNEFGRSVKTGDLSQTDRVCDFIVFASILAHQAVCNRNGVQPMTLRKKKDQYLTKQIEVNHLDEDSYHNNDVEREGGYSKMVDDDKRPLVPALKGSSTTIRSALRKREDEFENVYNHDQSLENELAQAEEGGRGNVVLVDDDDEEFLKELNAAEGAAEESEDDVDEHGVKKWSLSSRVKYTARELRDFLRNYARNIITRNGLGKDLYTFTLLIECLCLIIFTLTYYYIQGRDQGSIISNVQSNLLPGPYVLILFLSLVLLIFDRVCYISRQTIGKFVLVTFTILSLIIGYVGWINILHPDQVFLGSIYFAVKLFAAYLGCLQIRKGYSVDRRHDCFTHDPTSPLLSIGYTIYRAIPFFWEIRVCIDWSCEKSALAFDHFLKVEDMYDILYNRYVAMHTIAKEQPIFGTPFGFKRKVSDGLSRLVIMVVVLAFPLFYYSTFNPAMEDNFVVAAKTTITFDADNTIFSSSILNVDAYPGPLATYLERTRPTLESDDITSSSKTTQMLNLASCSSDIWSVSPQGMRLMMDSLNSSFYNKSEVIMTLSVTVERTGAQENSGKSQTIQTGYPITSVIAKDMMDAMVSESDAVTVILPRFYTPFIFNRPAVVEFAQGSGSHSSLGAGGASMLNPQDCTLRYRQEPDSNLGTNVSYWCLKCNSLFTYSNYPNSSYPEWQCITQGLNCKDYNLENQDTVYTPTAMYFVTISDKIPILISFLPNVGIVALYTTFVLTIGGVLRSMISGSVVNVVYMDMFDPTAVDKLVRYIYTARSGHDYILEQSLYYELLDLLRSPEALLEVTKKYPRGYKDGDDGPSPNGSPTVIKQSSTYPE